MVSKRLKSDTANIMVNKINFFLKRSLWKYLICSIILGLLTPISALGSVLSALLYFLGIMVILWPLQILSARSQAKKINFDADVEFTKDKILLKHRNKSLVETKDWDWVKSIDEKTNHLWLILNQYPPFGISIGKSELNGDEIAFFQEIIAAKYRK